MKLEGKKVSIGTAKLLDVFIYENRKSLDQNELTFLSEVRYAIYHQTKKPAGRRLTMAFLIEVCKEKVYNPEAYARRIGANSYSISYC